MHPLLFCAFIAIPAFIVYTVLTISHRKERRRMQAVHIADIHDYSNQVSVHTEFNRSLIRRINQLERELGVKSSGRVWGHSAAGTHRN